MSRPTPTDRPRGFLRRIWRRRDVKVLLAFVMLALVLRRPIVLVVPAFILAVRLLQIVYARVLDSVRAKLVAFYLHAAILPIVLTLCILMFVGYVVLGHSSAQVVERRLDAWATWIESRGDAAEAETWRRRAAGAAPETAAVVALRDVFAGSAATSWVQDGVGRVIAATGDAQEFRLLEPSWLAGRSFAGLVLQDGALELRLLRVLDADGGKSLLGAALRLTPAMLAQVPDEPAARLHGGLGAPGRPLEGGIAQVDSSLVRDGILAWYEPTVAGGDSAVTSMQQRLLRAVAARSRFPALSWDYRGHPVDWSTGRTEAGGPPILIAFSLEGATRALLRTSFETLGVVAVVVAVVCGLLVLVQVVATFRGFAYARAIAAAVTKLDHGVRALRGGDFGTRIQPRERDQLGRLALAFNDMSQQLQTLLQERAEHESVEREMATARVVQQRLFPERVPRLPYLEASGVCLPARTVSGDYYDFIPIRGGMDVVVADVSGKAMSAALLMASVHAALRSQYPLHDEDPPDPGAILARLNHHLHATLEPTRFVTLFLVRVQDDGRVLYGNAGHNPAALVRDGHVEWLHQGGLLLGPFAGPRFESTPIAVRADDVICLYTDGVTEAESPQGEHFGEDRLAAALQDGRHLRPQALQEAIVRSVRTWQGESEPTDDLTLVVLRLEGANA